MEEFTHSTISERGLSWKQQQDTHLGAIEMEQRHRLGLDVFTVQGPYRLSGHLLLNHGLCRRWGSLGSLRLCLYPGALRERGMRAWNPKLLPSQVWENLSSPFSPPLRCFSSLCSPASPTASSCKHNSSLKPGQEGRDHSSWRTPAFNPMAQRVLKQRNSMA